MEQAMDDPAIAWERELERRIRIYEQIEDAGDWPGRLKSVDYLAMAALTLVLTLGPWLWVH
jgi:hypothetical protein